LSAESIIPGVLLTGIDSDLPGKITGQIRSNVYDSVSGEYLLIPQGTRVLGDYDSKVSYGQERVLIVWRRLLFPDGSSINIENMPGVDSGGYSGLKDKVNNHYGRILTGVVIGSVIGAGAQMATDREYTTSNPGFDELAVQGAAEDINNVTQRLTERNLDIQPTLEIRPGSKFNIFVTKDVFLRAYG
jgi:type IV secretion system protein VirB10